MTSLLKFREIFKHTHCAVIGMIHVQALPGAPFNKMKCKEIVDAASEEAEMYKKCGVVISQEYLVSDLKTCRCRSPKLLKSGR
ncbi:uncharacterized protein LOC119185834 isoform X4 [Rhipicephalus microplus]|uniref:uncharacterized protein LOC119185834 isoform X4 n=1 Tax=Rhipicephalus microplus TaxID=6941 RepID=UPI003F6D5BBB